MKPTAGEKDTSAAPDYDQPARLTAGGQAGSEYITANAEETAYGVRRRHPSAVHRQNLQGFS